MKRALLFLGLAGLLGGFLPVADAEAQEFRFWKRKPLSGFGLTMPGVPRTPYFRRGVGPLPNYFFENRSSFLAPRRPLGHNDLAGSLRARGFKDVGNIQQRGSTFITEATGPSGERVRLVINGVTGGIDGVRVIGKGI